MNPKASLLVGILCIAFSPIFVKLAAAPPVTAGFYRLFIAWICIAVYCLFKGDLKIERKALLTALAGGIVFASDVAVWNISLKTVGATVSTLIANLAPLWVGLLGYLLFKTKSGIAFWAGTFIAILGMVILVGYRDILALHFNTGMLLALLASFFYAIYILITKDMLKSISTLTFMFYNMLASVIFLFTISLFQQNELVHFPEKTWLCFLGMALVCQVTGWLTINHSLRFLSSTKVSVALLLQTVLAALLASIFLKEKLGLQEIVGSVIVLGGVAVTFWKRGIFQQKNDLQ